MRISLETVDEYLFMVEVLGCSGFVEDQYSATSQPLYKHGRNFEGG